MGDRAEKYRLLQIYDLHSKPTSCISSSQSLDLHIPASCVSFAMVSWIHPSWLLSIFTTWVYKGVNYI